jgi:multidrug resistance efflux pump
VSELWGRIIAPWVRLAQRFPVRIDATADVESDVANALGEN